MKDYDGRVKAWRRQLARTAAAKTTTIREEEEGEGEGEEKTPGDDSLFVTQGLGALSVLSSIEETDENASLATTRTLVNDDEASITSAATPHTPSRPESRTGGTTAEEQDDDLTLTMLRPTQTWEGQLVLRALPPGAPRWASQPRADAALSVRSHVVNVRDRSRDCGVQTRPPIRSVHPRPPPAPTARCAGRPG